ncbi:ABC transporter permease [Bacillus carboniphilus]|uniref:ABC transporter permease n=1 Tax=Bacillus carboniphilus TaxID=86663 RepID=A0ABY9JV56_9BACI|nr:ABC transporter permease [Bacillus carboniphilus]WLR43286.1 ABC transporter permease [Bacillus carboniphilus]
MTAVSIAFAFLMGGGSQQLIPLPVVSELPQEETNHIIEQLNKEDVFMIELVEEKELKEMLENNQAQQGVILKEKEYTIQQIVETDKQPIIIQYLNHIYLEMEQIEQLTETMPEKDEDSIQVLYDQLTSQESFDIEKTSFQGEDGIIYDANLQAIFGFSLFFVMYTISYSVVDILREKELGIWDRLILSKTSKWKIYVSTFLYSFFVGYLQVLIIFSVFQYVLDIDFYGTFYSTLLLIIPYLLSIIALSMLISGLVKNMRQFNVVIPLVSVSMAMISGAYWPIEIVENKALLFVADLLPLTYGMEMLKGATLYQYGWMDLLEPTTILILMTVVMMGIGINLVEKRH